MTNSLLLRMVNKHGNAYLYSVLIRRGKLYMTTGEDNNTKTLYMRYSEYERERVL